MLNNVKVNWYHFLIAFIIMIASFILFMQFINMMHYDNWLTRIYGEVWDDSGWSPIELALMNNVAPACISVAIGFMYYDLVVTYYKIRRKDASRIS